MMTLRKSLWKEEFQKRKLLLFTMHQRKKQNQNFLKRFDAAMYECWLVVPPKWELVQMFKIALLHFMILIYHGDQLIWSNVVEEWFGKEISTNKYTYTAMLPREHSMPIAIRRWRQNNDLSARLSLLKHQLVLAKMLTNKHCPTVKSRLYALVTNGSRNLWCLNPKSKN